MDEDGDARHEGCILFGEEYGGGLSMVSNEFQCFREGESLQPEFCISAALSWPPATVHFCPALWRNIQGFGMEEIDISQDAFLRALKTAPIQWQQ